MALDRYAPPYRAACRSAGLELADAIPAPAKGAGNAEWTGPAWRALCLVAWGGGDVEAVALELAQRLRRSQADARSSARRARALTEPPVLPADAFDRLRAGTAPPKRRVTRADRGRIEADRRRTRIDAAEARRMARCEPLPGAVKLWDDCGPAMAHAGCSRWLKRRKIRATCRGVDLVRALPADGEIPDWTDRRWPLALPVWNVGGELVTVRGRWVEQGDPPNGTKERSPNGEGSARGFYANPAVLVALRGDGPVPPVVVVTEGAPDWLAWSCALSDPRIGVIGQWNGSDAAEAARVLAAGGTQLVINAQDADPPGDRLAELVRKTLKLEDARVRRMAPAQPADWTKTKPADWNDAARSDGDALLLDALDDAAAAEGIDL